MPLYTAHAPSRSRRVGDPNAIDLRSPVRVRVPHPRNQTWERKKPDHADNPCKQAVFDDVRTPVVSNEAPKTWLQRAKSSSTYAIHVQTQFQRRGGNAPLVLSPLPN